MDLPVRLQTEAGDEPVVSVDGAWGAPGLNLSHWPGNETPAELKRDLSTGCAFAFVRLEPQRREQLSAGCVAIANNHVDTDGVCATYVLRHPQAALEREDELLAAAEAGDFFHVPSEEAFVADAIVTGLAKGRPHERAYLDTLERLPAILAGQVAEHEALWRGPLERLNRDRARLERAARDDLVHLELSIWTGSTEAEPFAPGRHALFAATAADRALAIGPGGDGTTYRLIVNTTSWFDLPSRDPLPRPDLEALATRLNELEGTAGDLRWRAQPSSNAAPEL